MRVQNFDVGSIPPLTVIFDRGGLMAQQPMTYLRVSLVLPKEVNRRDRNTVTR